MEGWNTKSLGEVCEISLGKTPARNSPSLWDPDKATGNVWLSIADLPSVGVRPLVSQSSEHISDAGARQCRIVKEGTLLVSFKLTIGRLATAGRDLYTNEAIAALTPLDSDRFAEGYLYWYLSFFDWQKAAENDHKIKGKTLNKAKLKLLPVLIPPLAEQRRIVAILDEAFAAIETATAAAEKNLANARELFESVLEQQDYDVRPLGELVKIKTGKLDANAAVESGQYPFFTCSRAISQIDRWSFDCEAVLLAGNNASGDFNVKHYTGRFDAYQRTYVITPETNDALLCKYL